MRSSRLSADLTINATTRALAELTRRGVPVIDLTATNPTRVGLEYPPDLLTSLGGPAGLSYDPCALGLASAREAVSDDFARRGVAVAPDHVALTASTSEAYAYLFKLICDAGDSVLVPQPSYPLFEHLTVLELAEARPYRLEYHGEWRIDMESLHRAVDANTRAVLVVSPNNPTGSFLHASDLADVAAVCRAHDMMLIGDEVFQDYPVDDDADRVSVSGVPDVVACSLGGLSKSVGLPQVKVGWMGFTGPPSKLADLLPALELIADTYLSVSTPAQLALPDLLVHGATVRERIRQRIARNLSALRLRAVASPPVTVLPVEGGWSAVVQVPTYRSEEALTLELLLEDHVLVHPGYFFDFAREAFVVVSLLPEPASFDRGVDAMINRASRTP
jgi:aspartate/methionine/tyrosine aminotransferase